MNLDQTVEHERLRDSETRTADWKKWGPYVSERAWGTVREDYSADGDAWAYFPHDHARSRAYRWNEDGLGGFCNRYQNVCLAVALWNEKDPILKERLFGLTNAEGNHGEDVKEFYYYLDGVPSHAWMQMLYKYPQVEYPYAELMRESAQRGFADPEFELMDAVQAALAEGRYFDVYIEYAKATDEDVLCRIRVINRGPDPAPIHVLPQVWFRNTWSWGYQAARPQLQAVADHTIQVTERHIGPRWWSIEAEDAAVELLFTENDTNLKRLYGQPNPTPYVKDGINDCVVGGFRDRVNPARTGTKATAHCRTMLEPGQTLTVRVRFSDSAPEMPFADFDDVFVKRQQEADVFFAAIQPAGLTDDERRVQRQAYAGLLWNKQFYHYSVDLWLDGDPAFPPPPESRRSIRNADWTHVYCLDVLSMPDKWEYPWFAAWDLAFHTIPLALLDPEWAKRQLVLLLREWYMHPNGQLPAYEWMFSDVNPPVHAWAAWKVYQITEQISGHGDTGFLERVFQKLLLNFTWWVNRKDRDGNNIFSGGFLGLDNIGVFDRSAQLPEGGYLEQADGTAWMAMYCLNMLAIALELARSKPAYEDVATKFFEHFVYITHAFYHPVGHYLSLWDEDDGFFYDNLHTPGGRHVRLKTRSFVGLIPLLAVTHIAPDTLDRLPRFRRRTEWFVKYRPNLVENMTWLTREGAQGDYLLSIVGPDRLARILQRVLDPDEFLSDYGLRSLSKYHAQHPYEFHTDGTVYRVDYEPAESRTGLFGGNSNWRGPVWFPINYLLIEALREFHHYLGDSLTVELPFGAGNWVPLGTVADDLARRLTNIFVKNPEGGRPVYGDQIPFQADEHWRDLILFYEYFHGDSGQGLGASHQTGWTALVANLLHEIAPNGSL
ncbi:MAG: glucosidase [Anaerolineae bacterium]|nr:glucosidase [Anaerolineae bacterium]